MTARQQRPRRMPGMRRDRVARRPRLQALRPAPRPQIRSPVPDYLGDRAAREAPRLAKHLNPTDRDKWRNESTYLIDRIRDEKGIQT